MARKTKTIVINAEDVPGADRDYGKIFVITEMPAAKAERLAMRALMAVARSGIDLDDDVVSGGMHSIAMLGIQAITRVNFEDVEDLLDEMMQCVRIAPDPKHPSIARDLIEDDIEEVKTRIHLRKEVIMLHMGFSQGANSSTSASSASPSSSLNTPISPDPSVQFSRKK